MNSESLEWERVVVRRLRPDDLDPVIALDAKNTGSPRTEYFRVKLAQALADTGIEVSLAAEVEGRFAGFLLSRVYYGEFGQTDRCAILDTFDVHPEFAGQGVGRALLTQLRTNLLGLGIPRLQTEVAWSQQRLMSFFEHAGFMPAPRICLDLDLEKSRRLEEVAY